MSTPVGDGGVIQLRMAEDADIRRTNFRKLWKVPFSPTAAAEALWGTPSLWSDVYHGRKSFGEKLARQIEDRLSLARLSLDDPDGPRPAPITAELAEKLSTLSQDERTRVENVVRAMLAMDAIKPAGGILDRKPKQAA